MLLYWEAQHRLKVLLRHARALKVATQFLFQHEADWLLSVQLLRCWSSDKSLLRAASSKHNFEALLWERASQAGRSICHLFNGGCNQCLRRAQACSVIYVCVDRTAVIWACNNLRLPKSGWQWNPRRHLTRCQIFRGWSQELNADWSVHATGRPCAAPRVA